MKIIDNSPIGQPAVGRLVVISKELGSMVDCCLYLLPNNVELESDVESAIGYLSKAESTGVYLNAYDFEALENMDVFEGQAELLGASCFYEAISGGQN